MFKEEGQGSFRRILRLISKLGRTMLRIRFATDQDRIQGNYLLATRSVVRRLRGQIFEIAERDLELLNGNQIHYQVLPVPEPTGSDEEVRNPLTIEL
jgi:hypothetical protein